MSSENQRPDGNIPASDSAIRWLLALAGAKLVLHLIVNSRGAYGIFRDELYYLASADHLALGYVDHPPLSVWMLAGVRAVLGDSLFALRLLPALAGSALVVVTGLLARQLGGGRFAMLLAGLCPLVAGEVLAGSSVWSMNVFDLLGVSLVLLLFAKLIDQEDRRLWIGIGALFGLLLLNKVGALWVGLGVGVGTLATPQRRWLWTRWPWLGAVLSAGLFLPFVVWNATHEWAHLEFIEAAVTGKYSGLTVRSFLTGQFLGQNPTTFLVWSAGLVWLLFLPAGRRYRPLGLVWSTACLVLLVNGHSKAGYLANVYPALFAAGAVAWEQWLPARRPIRAVAWGLVASGLVFAPLAVPILPVETYVAYSRALGVAPGTDEGHELGALPQFYADMFGWRAKAETVAAAFHALPASERKRTVLFGENYGRAGAIDYWSDELGLPGAIGSHNSYWWWGPGDPAAEVVIVLGGERDALERSFGSVERAGTATCRWCIPYERDLPIYVARDPRRSVRELWEEIRHYD